MISVIPDIKSVVSESFKSSNVISTLCELARINSVDGLQEDYILTADVDATPTQTIDEWAEGTSHVGDFVTFEGITYCCSVETDQDPVTEPDSWNELWLTSVGWTPLGTADNPFKGYFRGGGFLIDHLYTHSNTNNIGLFGYTSGIISDLRISGDITGDSYVGGLASNNSGKITRCTFSGSITGGAYSGGLVSENTGTIEESFSAITVASAYTGNGFCYRNTGTITNSYATGSVSVSFPSSYACGFCTTNNGTITKSYSACSITGNLKRGFCSSNSGAVLDSFYDSTVCGLIDSATAKPKTTAELRNIATFTDIDADLQNPWNFVGTPNDDVLTTNSVWVLDPAYGFNSGRPYLLNNNVFIPPIAPEVYIVSVEQPETTASDRLVATGYVVDLGSQIPLLVYFKYRVFGSTGSWTNSATLPRATTGECEIVVDGLQQNTRYELVFVATYYTYDPIESDVLYGRTKKTYSMPECVALEATVTGMDSATLHGGITNLGNTDYAWVSFKCTKTDNPSDVIYTDPKPFYADGLNIITLDVASPFHNNTLIPFSQTQSATEKVFVISSLDRYLKDDLDITGDTSAVVKLGRNETRGFQFVVVNDSSDTAMESVHIEVGAFQTTASIKPELILYREHYVETTEQSASQVASHKNPSVPTGLYPDALIPFINPYTGEAITSATYLAQDVTISSLENQAYWVDVKVDSDVPSGVYTTEIIITADNDSIELYRIPVTIDVLDFVLPETTRYKKLFGGVRAEARDLFGTITDEQWTTISTNHDALLAEHNIPKRIGIYPHVTVASSAHDFWTHDTSFDTLDTLHTEFLNAKSDICSFYLIWNGSDNVWSYDRATWTQEKFDAQATNRRNYLEACEELYNLRLPTYDASWIKNPTFYIDEPNTLDSYNAIIAWSNEVKLYAPSFKVLVTEQPDNSIHAGFPSLIDSVDIWCPIFDYVWAPSDKENIQDRISDNDEVWSYTALVPRTPYYNNAEYYNTFCGGNVNNYKSGYCNWHLDAPLSHYLAPTWINYNLGITGLLYWTSTMFTGDGSSASALNDPWNNPETYVAYDGETKVVWNGEGALFYPGVDAGIIEGFVPSIRAKILRESNDDYKYLEMLEGVIGVTETKAKISAIVPNYFEYSQTNSDYISARLNIQNILTSRSFDGYIPFNQDLIGLEFGTSYTYEAIIEDAESYISYSDTDETFTTDVSVVPTLSLDDITNKTQTAITPTGVLTDLGSYTSVVVRFAISIHGVDTWTYSAWQTLTATGTFFAIMPNLVADTEYDVRIEYYYAYASVNYGEGTATASKQVTTLDLTAPSFELSPITTYDLRSATFSGVVTSFGSYESGIVYFQYRIKGASTWIPTTEVEVTKGGGITVTDIINTEFSTDVVAFSLNKIGLVEGTAYEVQGILVIGSTDYPSEIEEFTTKILTITAPVVSNISTTTAKVSASISNFGSYTEASNASVYFQYKISSIPIWTDTTEQDADTAIFTDRLTGLDAGSYYNVRTVLNYDTNSYIYSNSVTFKASNLATDLSILPDRDYITSCLFRFHEYTEPLEEPTYAILDATGLDLATATLRCNILTLGGYDNTYLVFSYRLVGASNYTDLPSIPVTSIGIKSYNLTNLIASRNYEYIARIGWSGDIGSESEVKAFSTKTAPVYAISGATNIGVSTATLNYIVSSFGSYSDISIKYEWKLPSDQTYLHSYTTPITTTGTNSYALTGLEKNTVYVYIVTISFGGIERETSNPSIFQTAVPVAPTISTWKSSLIRATDATMYGQYTKGDYETVAIKFQYRLSGGTWVDISGSVSLPVNGQFKYKQTLLTPETVYGYRAVLEYENAVPLYGSELFFTTKALPTIDSNDDMVNLDFGCYGGGYGFYGNLYGFYNSK